jgi:hypothetical protein
LIRVDFDDIAESITDLADDAKIAEFLEAFLKEVALVCDDDGCGWARAVRDALSEKSMHIIRVLASADDEDGE